MWTYHNNTFETLEEMWEYLRDYEYVYDEVDIERWIDDNYSASQIAWRLKDHETTDELWLELIEEYEDDVWSPEHMDDLIEGEDSDYNGYLFHWEDDEEKAE